MNDLDTFVRTTRKRLSVSAVVFAEYANVSVATVQRIERGLRPGKTVERKIREAITKLAAQRISEFTEITKSA